ncbi:outer membrane protein assembly factor BamA [Desulfurispirillum indicum]|uniref:outer membrane protein assembly factor BamA n=1 Tax=Desulfurispirillum indicum TaxID=936456 RepID=UPI001CFAF7F6|nr:outer membrane protein assembly factor BamA [Desulfurispirillum indicum]UCZ55682.1 outer membrane protein assembly factor BamA [Desulfurispirillum indicum]
MLKHFHTFLLVFLACVTFSLSALAAPPIDRIETEGLTTMSHRAFLDRIRISPGQALDPTILTEDIKSLYQLGNFEDIRVYRTSVDGDEVLRFVFVERPRVGSFSVEGNKRIRTDQIEEALSVEPNAIYSPELVARLREGLRQIYDSRGMQDVVITDESTFRASTRTYDIVFRVQEGTRARITDFIFEGASYKRKDFYRYMENREERWYSWLTGRGNLSRVKAEMDVQRLQQFYFDRGYLDVAISGPEYLLQDNGNYIIRYQIQEGDRYRLRTVQFRGARDLVTQEQLQEAMRVKEGEYFNSSRVHESIVAITRLFANQGYADASVRPMDAMDSNNLVVDLTFQITPGEPYTIGFVDITGNNKTRDKVIRRQMQLLEGDEYSAAAVDEPRRRLNNLRFFEELRLQERKTDQPGEMDIVIDVREAPTGMFNLGIGYSTVDRIVGTTSVSQGNLFGRGQVLNFSLEKSSERTYYSVSFTEPYLFDRDINFSLSFYDQVRQYTYYDDHRRGFSVTLGRPLFEEVRGNIRVKHEEINIRDVDSQAADVIKEMEGSATTRSIMPSLSRNTLDNRWLPTRGTRSTLFVEYAGGDIGGDNNFIKYGLTHSIYHPLWARLIGAVNVEMRFAEGHSGSTSIPPYERLYMGGINSMRGYRFREVGPKDETGEAQGGYKSFLTNLEMLYPLNEDGSLRFVLFYDIGNVYDRGENYLDDVLRSYGYGIRWLTPVGPLRLEYGYKVDPEPGESRSRLDFTIGTMF